MDVEASCRPEYAGGALTEPQHRRSLAFVPTGQRDASGAALWSLSRGGHERMRGQQGASVGAQHGFGKSDAQSPQSPLSSDRRFGAAGNDNKILRDIQLVNDASFVKSLNMSNRDPSSLSNGNVLQQIAAESLALRVLRRVLNSAFFEAFVGLIVLANCASMGVETSTALSRSLSGRCSDDCLSDVRDFRRAEVVFVSFYSLELCARAAVCGVRRVLTSKWTRMDLLIVVCGWLEAATGALLDDEFGVGDALERLALMRLFRLTRWVRAVRLHVQFRSLWLLVRGMDAAVGTVLWAVVIMLIIIYVFAVLAVDMIPVSPLMTQSREFREAALQWFPSMTEAVLSLLQIMTLDDAADIYQPLVKESYTFAAFFVGFLLCVSVALMNLVTAVIVDTAIKHAAEDREAIRAWEASRRQSLLPQLEQLVSQLDSTQSGFVTLSELEAAPVDLLRSLGLALRLDNPLSMLEQLDYSESGEISISDLCEGALRLQDTKDPELQRVCKQATELIRRTSALEEFLATGDPVIGVRATEVGAQRSAWRAERRRSSMGCRRSILAGSDNTVQPPGPQWPPPTSARRASLLVGTDVSIADEGVFARGGPSRRGSFVVDGVPRRKAASECPLWLSEILDQAVATKVQPRLDRLRTAMRTRLAPRLTALNAKLAVVNSDLVAVQRLLAMNPSQVV